MKQKISLVATTTKQGEFITKVILEGVEREIRQNELSLTYHSPETNVVMFDPTLQKNVTHTIPRGETFEVKIDSFVQVGETVTVESQPFSAKTEIEVKVKGETLPAETVVEIINHEVDQWLKEEYIDGTQHLGYRLFVPRNTNQGNLPLVVALHGSGETAEATGNDNRAQLASSRLGLNFAQAAWQDNQPCYVLMPQFPSINDSYDYVGAWELYHGLIEKICHNYQIDNQRIYLAALSMGARQAYKFLELAPPFFAAAILNCGNQTDVDLAKIANIPLRVFHVEGDTAIPSTCTQQVIKEMSALEPRDFKAEIFPEAFIETAGLSNSHAVWEYTMELPELKSWLFKH